MHRRALGRVRFPRAGGGEREDVGDVERPREEVRVSREMRFEQVQAAAMERHDRCVRRLEAMLDIHLEDAVLGGRVPAISPKEMFHGVCVHTIRADEPDP